MNAEICKQLGISRSVTSAYHPQTNGLDERTNQTLKVRMAKLVNEYEDDWDEYLEEIAFSICTQKQASTKYSPSFLMFGRHARSPMEASIKLQEDLFLLWYSNSILFSSCYYICNIHKKLWLKVKHGN